MKKLILPIFAVLMSVGPSISAQTKIIKLVNDKHTPLDSTALKVQKSNVVLYEKAELKKEVVAIEKQLASGKITAKQADVLKKSAAKKRAKNIEDQLDIIDANLNLLRRNKANDGVVEYYSDMEFLYKNATDSIEIEDVKKASRTSSGIVISFGLSNAIGKGQSLNDSPYKIGGSRYFQIGYQFSTKLMKNGFLRLNYGLAFQFNGLKPTDNRWLVRQGEETVLEEFPHHLKKMKFRQDNLIAPIHFELTPDDSDGFKLGIGGYLGLNLNTIQKMKFTKDGHREKQKRTDGLNTNNFIYGLSAYVGYDWISVYISYELNPIFKHNPIDEHMVAIGLRISSL